MEKIIYDGFVTLKEVDVEIKGRKRVYNEICVKDAVAAILVDETGRLGVVNQFRPFVGKVTREVVAETLDKQDLSPLETLMEGIEEEAEITKEDIIDINPEPIFIYYMMVGCSKSEVAIYEIKVKKQENKKVNDGDVDSIEWLTLEELGELIKSKKIKDSKIILSYYYLKDKMNENN